MRKSNKLKALEDKYIGKRVVYYLEDIRYKKSNGTKLFGPYTGIVKALTNNSSMIEDRLEGYTHRNSISPTGRLIVIPDDIPIEDFPSILNTEILDW